MKINIKRDYWILIIIVIIVLAIVNGLLKYSGYSIKEVYSYHCSDNPDYDKCICKDDEVKARLEGSYFCISIECKRDSDCATKSAAKTYTCNKPDITKPQSGYCV